MANRFKRPRVPTCALRLAAAAALACAFAAPSAIAQRSTTQLRTVATPLAQLAPGEEDTDGDGIPDNEDACKRVKGVASDIPRNNGCPPPVDTDGDGVADDNDACPKKAGVASTDPNLNGCPPPPPPRDRDGDGIPDRDDACPWKKGVASDDPKRNGCPDPAGKAVAAPRVTSTAVTTTNARVSTAAAGPAELTFAGFRSFDDGTSLVFIELSSPVTVNLKSQLSNGRAGSTLVYVLENTKVPIRNNRNPLDAVDFPSVLRRATITQKKKSVEVAVTLKEPVQPETQVVQRGDKTVLEIRLPKAQRVTSAEPEPAAEAPPPQRARPRPGKGFGRSRHRS